MLQPSINIILVPYKGQLIATSLLRDQFVFVSRTLPGREMHRPLDGRHGHRHDSMAKP